MVFLYPSFLWALAAVLLPVIIHLFNFRRYKKVYFSNVKFLRELQLESKSRSRLKELLILLARCLAIVALVLAFARPFFPASSAYTAKGGTRVAAIYVDNSFSMENVGRQGPLLDLAKLRASEIIKAFGPSARFYIVTNNFGGSEQRLFTQDNALTFVEDIKTSATPRMLSTVYERQKSFLQQSGNGGGNAELFLISDAQKSTFDLQNLQTDSLLPINILPLQPNQVNNLFVDTCWFESPVQQKGFRQRLFATVVNSGNKNVEAGAARLYLNEKQVSLATFSVRAGATATVDFSFAQNTEGFNYGRVEIDDYPVSFDDRLFYAFNARLNINVVLLNNKNLPQTEPFSALFGNDSIFTVRAFSEKAIDYSAFARADLLVLNQITAPSSGLMSEIKKFTATGGGIIIVPPAEPGPEFNSALGTLQLPVLGKADSVAVKTSTPDLASGFFEGVFEKMDARVNMPVVNFHFPLQRQGTMLEPVLSLENGDDLLLSSRHNNARVFLFTSPLLGRHSNFTRHALFVPTIFRIALSSISIAPAFYDLHQGVMIGLRNIQHNPEYPPHIIGLSEEADIIPEKRLINSKLLLYPRDQITRPGFYVVQQEKQNLLPLAFNYPRIESELTAHMVDDLIEIVAEKGWKNVSVNKNASSHFNIQSLAGAGDSHLWKLFIILALVFLLAEILLLRFLK